MASMDRYNGEQIEERSRGSRERDVTEAKFGRLNSDGLERSDHYGRGRGRSPVPRRRRSRSPPTSNIDRYVPGGSPRQRRSRSPQRPRFEVFPITHPSNSLSRIDRYIPGGGGASAPAPALMDPHKLDYSVTYSYFSEWYQQMNGKDQETISKDEIQTRYDSYKDDLNARLAKLFVSAHKGDEWFKERYMPGVKEATKFKIIEYRKEQWYKWKGLLELGAFDSVDRETKFSSQKLETNGENNVDVVEEINRGVDDGGLKPVLLIKTISPTVSRAQLEELARTNIENFHFVSLSDPNPLKKFHRIGFILTKPNGEGSDAKNIVDDSTVDLLNGKSIHDAVHGDFVCHVGIHNGPTNARAKKLLNEYMSMPQNLKREAELIERSIKKLESELRDDSNMEEYDGWEMLKDKVELWGVGERQKRQGSEEEGEEGADDEVELKILKKKIDIGVEYLRRAFNFCVYCVSASDSIHELTRKCPGGHIRRPTPSPDYVADTRTINWTKNWQEKLELFVNPPDPDLEDYAERLKKIGGKPVADALQEVLLKFVKQEGEGKYRCKVQGCPKLFRAEEFWKKHLEKKHAEWLQLLEADAILVNSYVSDPTRVHPPKIEQNAQGNFQAGGIGSSRNTTMLPLNLMTGGPPGGFQPPPGFPFNAAFLQATASSNSSHGNIMIGAGGVGPIRRRDNRNQSAVTQTGRRDRYGQPYTQRDRADREKERERRDREMKEAQSKRGTTNTTVGGEAELAVMGRAVKSYKDLDATEGKKAVDELDY